MYTLIKLGWCLIKQGSPISRPWTCSLTDVSPWPVEAGLHSRMWATGGGSYHLLLPISLTLPPALSLPPPVEKLSSMNRSLLPKILGTAVVKDGDFSLSGFLACPGRTLSGWFWDSLEGLLRDPTITTKCVLKVLWGLGILCVDDEGQRFGRESVSQRSMQNHF